MARFTHNGRPFDAKRFMADIKAKAIEAGARAIEAKVRGAASSIIDPETGRHADVFVDRAPESRLLIRTTGSPTFARLLEQRLGITVGREFTASNTSHASHPKVYLAHATEDKAQVRPIAEYLMAHGVEVWFDEWEIEPGDSLREKMEQGLGEMTHFVVVLTETSITKPWVAKEIDVGMVRQVGGESRFVPLVVDVNPARLSPFIQAMLFLTLDPSNENELKALVGRLHGVSRKPSLGAKPRYVTSIPDGLLGWSPAAIAIGRHIVENSTNATVGELPITLDGICTAIDIACDDARIALLDLLEAGYVSKTNARGYYLPAAPLFVDFDEAFMPFSPKADAQTVANKVVSGKENAVSTKLLAEELGWQPRRINSAICYLERAGAIESRHTLGSAPWRSLHLVQTDRTLRFARQHS